MHFTDAIAVMTRLGSWQWRIVRSLIHGKGGLGLGLGLPEMRTPNRGPFTVSGSSLLPLFSITQGSETGNKEE